MASLCPKLTHPGWRPPPVRRAPATWQEHIPWKSGPHTPARFLRGSDSMTQPRYALRGDTVMVTRRTVLRRHLFRPEPAIRQLYLYCLAVCAKQHGILLHAATLMSTHEHLVFTDPERTRSLFLRDLHRLVSLCTKALRKWEGPVWDQNKSSIVRLLTGKAIIEKLAYVMANPVKAGLVAHARDWPGVTVLPNELGRRTLRINRPSFFFREKNHKWPDTVELTLTLPPTLEESYSAEEVREAVALELEEQERDAKSEVKKRGRPILGAKRVRGLSPFRRATSSEPPRDRNPTFAVGRGEREAFLCAARALRAFRLAYREAFTQWKAGLRSVVFPRGTWSMWHQHGVVMQE